MKIVDIETLSCRAGWRDWTFLKISTDEGIVGYSSCTDFHGSTPGVIATVRHLSDFLIGQDPRCVEKIYWDLYRITRQSSGGIVQKSIGAIENALLDIKARALNIPVYELLGGPLREEIRLYWSHCGTTRVRSHEYINREPVLSLDGIGALGKEVIESGYLGLKTNIILFEDKPRVLRQGFVGGYGSTDRKASKKIVRGVEKLLGTFRDSVGPDLDIILDVNMHFRIDGNLSIAQAAQPFNLTWLELDPDDPKSLSLFKQKATMPIASGEKQLTIRGYRPFFEAHAMDIAILDVSWNGILQSKKIADLAETYEMNVAPHNHGSPLATIMTAHFCAAVSNLVMMEYDVDDVPWRDDIVSKPPVIKSGHLQLPTGPGWGADLNEEVIKAHTL